MFFKRNSTCAISPDPSTPARLRRRRPPHGLAFVIAMCALVIMLGIGTTFMAQAAQHVTYAQQELKNVEAFALAEGAVNYAIWNQNDAPTANQIANANIPSAASVNVSQLSSTTANPSPLWHSTLSTNGTNVYVWLFQYPNSTSPTGYEVVAVGSEGSENRAVRSIFAGGSSSPNTSAETADFSNTLYCNSSLTFNGDCAISGNTMVNGDLTMSNSGRFVKQSGSGGNVSVNGTLSMSGSAQIQGTASVNKDVNLTGGSPVISGAVNALGNLSVANAGITCDNAFVNGNATISGSTLGGTITCGGNFKNTGWGTAPSAVHYGGTYSNTGTSSFNGISSKTSVTALPATTGTVSTMPVIDMTQYKQSSYGTPVVPGGGTLTVNNGSPQFTNSTEQINGNLQFTGGPNVMNLPSNMNYYINGNLTASSGNTTFNGTDVTLYVNGNVTIGGTFNFNASGKVIIVATGTINIGGGYNFHNTNVVLMSQTGITIGGSTNPINAMIYTHNSTGTASFTANSCTINGAIICDKTVFSGSGNAMYYAPPTYPFLPGGGSGNSGSTSWTAASWEELY